MHGHKYSDSANLLHSFRVELMNTEGNEIFADKRSGFKKLIFPGCVLMIYGIFFVISPAGAGIAVRSSTAILLNLMVPLGLVFTLMVIMNLFLKPTHIVRFLGKGPSSRGIILSTAAGIISMGPIEIIPATAESMIPLLLDPLPRNLTICVGFKNRFIKTIQCLYRNSLVLRVQRFSPPWPPLSPSCKLYEPEAGL